MAATVAWMSPAEMEAGMTDESITRSPFTLCTRNCSSTAAAVEEEDGPNDTLPIQLDCGNAFSRI